MLHLGGHSTKRLAVLIGLTAAIFGPTQAECRWVLVNGHQHELCDDTSDLSVLPPLPDLPLLPTLRPLIPLPALPPRAARTSAIRRRCRSDSAASGWTCGRRMTADCCCRRGDNLDRPEPGAIRFGALAAHPQAGFHDAWQVGSVRRRRANSEALGNNV
jgi:hypothetical protein